MKSIIFAHVNVLIICDAPLTNPTCHELLVNVFSYRLYDGVSVLCVQADFGQIHYVTEITTYSSYCTCTKF